MAYTICRDKTGRDVLTSRDCPNQPGLLGALGFPSVAAIRYDAKVFVATGEKEDDFWIFVEDHAIWDAGGPLSGGGE